MRVDIILGHQMRGWPNMRRRSMNGCLLRTVNGGLANWMAGMRMDNSSQKKSRAILLGLENHMIA